MSDERNVDPTRVSEQPALQGGRATTWLVAAGILGAIAVTLFILNIGTSPGLAWIGIAVQVAAFAGMVTSVTTSRPGRLRSRVLLSLMVVMAVVALILLVAIAIVAATTP